MNLLSARHSSLRIDARWCPGIQLLLIVYLPLLVLEVAGEGRVLRRRLSLALLVRYVLLDNEPSGRVLQVHHVDERAVVQRRAVEVCSLKLASSVDPEDELLARWVDVATQKVRRRSPIR